MEKMTIGTAILSGGRSRRMGEDKANLSVDGSTFLEMLLQHFSSKERIYLSVSKGRSYDLAPSERSRILYVEDKYEGCGPLGGIHALLAACQEDALFVTAVDLPLADALLKEELAAYLSPGIDAVIPISEDGRVHPVCAIYQKSALASLYDALENDNYRLYEVLRHLRVCYVPVDRLTDGKEKLLNINTPADYAHFLKKCKMRRCTNRHHIPVLSVAAYSGSGKTTFLERLIRELKARGLRLVVCKHDGHDFQIDREGKDSDRFAKAGADCVILVSKSKSCVMHFEAQALTDLVDAVQRADLILIEGAKHGPYPKILLHRRAAGKEVAVDLQQEMPVMIVSDERNWAADCPILGLDEIERAADEVVAFMKQYEDK